MSALLWAAVAVAVAVAALAAVWVRVPLRAVTYSTRVTPGRAFAGEAVELTVEIVNRKALPVPWLISRETVPADLRVEGGRLEPHYLSGKRELVQGWSLGGRKRHRRRYAISADERGLYVIGPTVLRAGDPFGWRECVADTPERTRLLVYPRPFPLAAVAPLTSRPFGSRAVQGWIFADPLQVVGARPYRPGDPFRAIHWTATARTGEVQVRQILPARSLAIRLFVDIRTAEHAWQGIDRARAEATLSIAAAVAQQTLLARGELGLYCNAPIRDETQDIRIGSAAGMPQLLTVLEALALAGTQPWVHIEHALAAEARTIPLGIRVIVVTPMCTAEIIRALAGLGGRPADLILVGDAHPAHPPDRPGQRVVGVHDADIDRWWKEGAGR